MLDKQHMTSKKGGASNQPFLSTCHAEITHHWVCWSQSPDEPGQAASPKRLLVARLVAELSASPPS